MSSLLFIYADYDPAAQLTETFFAELCKYLHMEFSSKKAAQVRRSDVDSCDVFVTVRTQVYLDYRIAKYAKEQGKLCGILLDDDFTAIPDYSVKWPTQYMSLTNTIKLSDLLFSVNEHLGKVMKELSSDGTLIKVDTAVDKETLDSLKLSSVSGETVNIVYYVNDGSDSNYKAILLPVINELNACFPGKYKWHMLALTADPKSLPDGVSIYPHMSLEAFRAMLKNTGFSFGVAPLLLSEFNQAKYNNKFVEYTLAGLPCIYSAVPPYDSFITDGYDGILCEQNTDSWVDAIIRLSGERERAAIFNNAKSTMRSRLSSETVFEEVKRQCPSLAEYNAPEKGGDAYLWFLLKASSKLVSLADPFIRAYGRVKTEGVVNLFQYVYQRFRFKLKRKREGLS